MIEFRFFWQSKLFVIVLNLDKVQNLPNSTLDPNHLCLAIELEMKDEIGIS